MVCIQENGSANRGVIGEEARHLRRGGEAALIEPDAKPNFNQREDVSDWGKDETAKFPKLGGVLLGLGIHRSEVRRVGTGCVCTCSSRWLPSHYNKHTLH